MKFKAAGTKASCTPGYRKSPLAWIFGGIGGGGRWGGINPYAKVSTRLSEMEGIQYSPDFTFISFTCVNV